MAGGPFSQHTVALIAAWVHARLDEWNPSPDAESRMIIVERVTGFLQQRGAYADQGRLIVPAHPPGGDPKLQ